MATELDDALVGPIADLITRVGIPAIFDTTAGSVYDPETGTVIRPEVGPVTVKATPPGADEKRPGDGTGLSRGAQTYIAAEGLTFEPRVGMSVTFKDRVWAIGAVHPIHSGDQVAAYRLELGA